jgi:hypothetical protein
MYRLPIGIANESGGFGVVLDFNEKVSLHLVENLLGLVVTLGLIEI